DEQLQQSIQMIYQAKNVVVYGVSSSGIAGLDMQNRLMRIGRSIEVVTDSHNQMIRSNSADNETVIIAISLTGSTKDSSDAVENSEQNGDEVIAITNYTGAPLAEFADIIVLTSAKENPLDSGSLVSRIAQLYIIGLLCTGIAIEDHGKARKADELVPEPIS